MIYRPVRERDPERDRRHASSTRGARRRLRRDVAHLPVDRRLLVHHAARQEGDGQARARSTCRSSVSSLRAYGLDRGAARRDPDGARHAASPSRPRPARSACATSSTRTSPKSSSIETAERVFSRGWSRMKLYFMIGLPTEEDEDVRGIVETGARARDVGQQRAAAAARPRSPSASARTCPSRTRRSSGARWTRARPCSRKQRILRDAARADAASSCACTTREGSWLEGILARGDRALGDVLERACRNGARFDSWDEQLKLERLGRGLRALRHRHRHATSAPSRSPRAALGPHRRRPRGRLPGQGVPQGAEEPAQPAVRQGRRQRSSTTRTSRTHDADAQEARLLRLRRRLRPDADARQSAATSWSSWVRSRARREAQMRRSARCDQREAAAARPGREQRSERERASAPTHRWSTRMRPTRASTPRLARRTQRRRQHVDPSARRRLPRQRRQPKKGPRQDRRRVSPPPTSIKASRCACASPTPSSGARRSAGTLGPGAPVAAHLPPARPAHVLLAGLPSEARDDVRARAPARRRQLTPSTST